MIINKENISKTLNYEKISNHFIEDDKMRVTDMVPEYNAVDMINVYNRTIIPKDYKLIIDRLDEIQDLITTKVAHKEDIQKSKIEIIQEQKKQLDETKNYIGTLLKVLDKKSAPRIFTAISVFGLALSSVLLIFTILFGVILLTKIHILISTLGFILMFLMSRLSSKLHYGKHT